MPELPEVETVRRTLEPHLLGRHIQQTSIFSPIIIKKIEPEEFVRLLTDRKIETVDRRGKFLLIRLAGNYTWVTHLRMTGRLVHTQHQLEHKHLRLQFKLDDGSWLSFVDMRKFGTMYLLPGDKLDEIHGLRVMGPEPLGADFNLADFMSRLSGSRRAVKTLLLDQTVVAGLGNIYVDEALFLAKVHPGRAASSLTFAETEKLYYAIKNVLEQGIKNRGTSFSDYVDGAGKKGDNQTALNVYSRKGQDCPHCGQEIRKTRLGGRGTSFCPGCQQ